MGCCHSSEFPKITKPNYQEQTNLPKPLEEILKIRAKNGNICRQIPVKETHKIVRAEDENGNKMINEYIREEKIGSGTYGKVARYRSSVDGNHYAIKAYRKSRLVKHEARPSDQSALTNVHHEILILKMLQHTNIVNLIEVIDDPKSDQFYMVIEYIEGKSVCESVGPNCGLSEETARRYFRDMVSGLSYLHDHNIIHGNIKPDNMLITRNGTVKIRDFLDGQAFEDDNDVQEAQVS